MTVAYCRSSSTITNRHAVTDVNSPGVGRITSRHSRRPSAYEDLSLSFDARRYADVCATCRTAISARAPVAVGRVNLRLLRGLVEAPPSVSGLVSALWAPGGSTAPDGPTVRLRSVRVVTRQRRRRLPTAAYRQKVCTACGQRFTATRVDVTTYGHACRTRLYR